MACSAHDASQHLPWGSRVIATTIRFLCRVYVCNLPWGSWVRGNTPTTAVVSLVTGSLASGEHAPLLPPSPRTAGHGVLHPRPVQLRAKGHLLRRVPSRGQAPYNHIRQSMVARGVLPSVNSLPGFQSHKKPQPLLVCFLTSLVTPLHMHCAENHAQG